MPLRQTNYVNCAGGEQKVAGGQMQDDILHMASHTRYPDRCFSLATTIRVLNQELQL